MNRGELFYSVAMWVNVLCKLDFMTRPDLLTLFPTMTTPDEDMAQAQRIIKGTATSDQSQDLLRDISGISAGEESGVSIPIPNDLSKQDSGKRKSNRKSPLSRKKSSVLLQKSLLEREVEAEIERQTAYTAQQVDLSFDFDQLQSHELKPKGAGPDGCYIFEHLSSLFVYRPMLLQLTSLAAV